jgi:hypothetical protein
MILKFFPFSLGLACVLAACRSVPDPSQDGAVQHAPLDPGIAARVNGEVITWAEVASGIAHLKNELAYPELRQATLKQAVEDRLLRQSVAKNHITVTEQELDDLVQRHIEGSPPFPSDLYEGCQKTISIAEFRENLRKGLLYDKLFQQFVVMDLLRDEPITEDGVRIFFEGHRNQFEGTFDLNRVRIDQYLKSNKRRDDREKVVALLFRQAQVIPADLCRKE